MTTVFWFSGSGHSYAVAKALSDILDCGVERIGDQQDLPCKREVAVVVFPVYCQNIPNPVAKFLKNLYADHIALLATYGKISYGNVLHEAKNMVHGEVIAGAYVPMGHTFRGEDCFFQSDFLLPFAERIRLSQKADIPKTPKNPLADIFPALRSRMSVRITKNELCNECGLCTESCPMRAIQNGKINAKCIRCLRCVTICPPNALQFKNIWILEKYLKAYNKEEYILY
jgi:ferredoxin